MEARELDEDVSSPIMDSGEQGNFARIHVMPSGSMPKESDVVVASNVPGQQKKLENGQIRNEAGGFVFKTSNLDRLKRYLILGTEGGTYYASAKEHGKQNIDCIISLIKDGRGKDVVDVIKKYSNEGRCPKQLPIVHALANCARYHDGKHSSLYVEARKAAYDALPFVCRTPTDLFHFVAFCEIISKSISNGGTGWGRAHRKAIAKWYLTKPGEKLAYLVTKYKQRDGWSHRDLLRLCHPKPCHEQKSHQVVFKYITKGFEECQKFAEDCNNFPSMDEDTTKTYGKLKAANEALQIDNRDLTEDQKEKEIITLICDHQLVREVIPTKFLKSLKVLFQLLHQMPMNALIRNLGSMSSEGIFEDKENHHGTEVASKVAEWLVDNERLKKARIHPFNVLLALKTYESGKGDKGSKTWKVNKLIVDALDKAFYKSFQYVEPTKKRYLLGIDVSGSMSYAGCKGCQIITPAVAAAAMAMVAMKTEPKTTTMAFSDKFRPLPLNKDMALADVIKETKKLMFGSTDCAQPMVYAMEKKIEVDVFIIYTDNETWIGEVHPHHALLEYRKNMNIPDARLIVCAMTSNGFTIADPEDPLMLDIVGFDSAAPQIIAEFVNSEPELTAAVSSMQI